MATQTEEIDQKVIVPTEAIIESETTTHQEASDLAAAATEIVPTEYVHEISTTTNDQTIDASQLVETTTVHLVHDAQSVPQQVIETTTTTTTTAELNAELNAAAAMLSVGNNNAAGGGVAGATGAGELQVIQQLDVAATPVLAVGDNNAQGASYTISSSADGRLIVSTDGGQSTEILMLNQGQGNQVQVVTATPTGADGSTPPAFTLALTQGAGTTTPSAKSGNASTSGAGGSASKSSPNMVKLERQKQQKRLLRKLQACAQEYCLRLGEECAVVASVRSSSHSSSSDHLGQREVQVFGSKSFEEILRQHTDAMKVVLEEKEKANQTTSSLDAVLPGASGVPVLPLPPRDLDAMNGNELKSYVPLLLRHCMGRSRPMWGMDEHRPVWWPPEIPFQNVRMDTREAGQQREKQTWSSCLRQMVRACFLYFGCDALLQGLPKSHSSSQCNMVVFSQGGGTPTTVAVSDQSVLEQTITSPDEGDQPQEATTVSIPSPSAGATVVDSGNEIKALATTNVTVEAPVATPTTRKRRRASAKAAETISSSSPRKRGANAGSVKIHYKTENDEEGLSEMAVSSKLTCGDVLSHVGRDDKEYELRTAYNDGTGLVGNVANLVSGKEGIDVYVVKIA